MEDYIFGLDEWEDYERRKVIEIRINTYKQWIREWSGDYE